MVNINKAVAKTTQTSQGVNNKGGKSPICPVPDTGTISWDRTLQSRNAIINTYIVC